MNALILQLTRVTTVCLTVFGVGCFALLSTPKVFGVVPAPDGGYGPPDYGAGNTAEGEDALLNLSLGTFNTATGYRTLFNNRTGIANIAIGAGALFNNTTSIDNVAIGLAAGRNLTTGHNNIVIANDGVAGESGNIRIGNPALQHKTVIVGISTAAGAGVPVVINGAGQLGVAVSSRQFKDDIKPMEKTSEAILALRPVTFQYKRNIDPDCAVQFGLVAKDVEKIDPDLVVRDKEGKPYSVRYEAVNAMLLNEFLKEHKKVMALQTQFAQQQREFESKLSDQQKQIESLAASLQKVSAEIETNRPAPHIVANRN
jgi:trimeric autotransporter adhesin